MIFYFCVSRLIYDVFNDTYQTGKLSSETWLRNVTLDREYLISKLSNET